MRRPTFPSIIAPVIAFLAACATYGRPVLPSLEPGWTREELRTRAFVWSCEPTSCNRTWRTPRGPLVARARGKTYDLHEIPGWNTESTAARVATGILGFVLRRNGWTTESVQIGIGTRTVTDSGPTSWELRCSAYWIDDQEEEYNKADEDHVARAIRRSEGAVCHAVDLADTSIVLWRFRAGIAPSRDSLAAVYDSVRATNSALVSASPPMSLERVAPDGDVAASYPVTMDLVQAETSIHLRIGTVRVSRERDSPPIGMIHRATDVSLDLAPNVTGEEMRILRLLSGLIAFSFKGAVE